MRMGNGLAGLRSLPAASTAGDAEEEASEETGDDVSEKEERIVATEGRPTSLLRQVDRTMVFALTRLEELAEPSEELKTLGAVGLAAGIDETRQEKRNGIPRRC